MLGPQHRLFAAAAATVVTVALHQDPSVVIGSAVLAQATSAGRSFSPDLDQSDWWIDLGKWVTTRRDQRDGKPDGLFGHRGVTHWWVIPLVAAGAIPLLAPKVQWVYFALWLGWTSHLVGDAIFGKLSIGPAAGRMERRVGVGLKTSDDTWASKCIRPVCYALIGGAVLASFGLLGPLLALA